MKDNEKKVKATEEAANKDVKPEENGVKLTDEQIEAKETIIAKIYDAVESDQDGQLVFVQGEAGTGKTVLNSSIFYEILTNGEDLFGREIDCHILVNHDQQITVYEQIAKRLGLGDDIVHKPTQFINKFSEERKVDVAFVDEAHLLLTRGNQGYSGHNQLEDIIKRSRVTVVMFDEYQILNNEEYSHLYRQKQGYNELRGWRREQRGK